MSRKVKSDTELCVRVSVSFEPEDYQWVVKYCEQHDRTIAWVVRKALADWKEKHDNDPVI